jgi:hypothetical protein
LIRANDDPRYRTSEITDKLKEISRATLVAWDHIVLCDGKLPFYCGSCNVILMYVVLCINMCCVCCSAQWPQTDIC